MRKMQTEELEAAKKKEWKMGGNRLLSVQKSIKEKCLRLLCKNSYITCAITDTRIFIVNCISL